jgi:hypothetical protein
LRKLLPEHSALVVECLAKITDVLDQDSQIYLSAKDAIPILEVGFSAEDPIVRANAERARENFLRLGRFEYLEVGTGFASES